MPSLRDSFKGIIRGTIIHQDKFTVQSGDRPNHLHAHLHHRIGQQAALPGHIVQTGMQGIGDTGTGTEQERILLRVGIVGRTVGGQGIQSPFGMGGNALGVELQLAGRGVDTPFQNAAGS